MPMKSIRGSPGTGQSKDQSACIKMTVRAGGYRDTGEQRPKCMHQDDSACRRIQRHWTSMGSSCNSSEAICLAMRAGMPAYRGGCVVRC